MPMTYRLIRDANSHPDVRQSAYKIEGFPNYLYWPAGQRMWSLNIGNWLKEQAPNKWNGWTRGWCLQANGRRRNFDKDKLKASAEALWSPTSLGELLRAKLQQQAQGGSMRGNYIVGSITKQTGIWSISSSPRLHSSRIAAEQEAARLAQLNSDKKFVVLQVGGIVSMQQLTWE